MTSLDHDLLMPFSEGLISPTVYQGRALLGCNECTQQGLVA